MNNQHNWPEIPCVYRGPVQTAQEARERLSGLRAMTDDEFQAYLDQSLKPGNVVWIPDPQLPEAPGILRVTAAFLVGAGIGFLLALFILHH